MYHTLEKILCKPNDYKICISKDCDTYNKLNWYENDICISCWWNLFSDTWTKEVISSIEREIEWCNDEWFSLEIEIEI